MAILTTALVSALAPAAIDAVKTLFGGIARKVGGLSVDDEIKLLNANVQKLEALAKLDNPVGTPSQWVVDLRSSFRYVAAGICITGGFGSLFVDSPAVTALGLEMAAAAFSFIFGERTLLAIKGTPK
jgi:hypothetical protein